jgi:hypothetical protein
MGRTACTEPQCLYKGALYLFYYCLISIYTINPQFTNHVKLKIKFKSFFIVKPKAQLWTVGGSCKGDSVSYRVGNILLVSIVKITITLRCQRKHLRINTSCHATFRHDDKCLEKGKTRIMENVTAFVLSEDSSKGKYGSWAICLV